MLRTPKEAAEALCPLARTFATQKAETGCRGPNCMCWRWEQITTGHPFWLASVRGIAAETGEKPPYPKAAAEVASRKAELGLVPEKGWCGIGGAA